MLNAEKCRRDITYWGHDMQNIPNTKFQVATSKMKLQQGNRKSGDKTLSRQTFWVTTEMTIIQDSVAIRTRTEILWRQEKLGRDTNLKKHLSITVVTKKTLSRLKSKEKHKK